MKMNKKGFTLAELLIVIAIIAILIAIAIPVFGSQLENARIQADHANIRSAYAIVQTAKIVGVKTATGIDTDGDTTKDEIADGWVYTREGVFDDDDSNAVTMTVTDGVDPDICAKAVGCPGTGHENGNKITAITSSGDPADLTIELK